MVKVFSIIEYYEYLYQNPGTEPFGEGYRGLGAKHSASEQPLP